MAAAAAAADSAAAATSTTAPVPGVKATGYLGFGSFHSDNVEELMAIPDEAYVPPPPPRRRAPAEVVAAACAGSGGRPPAFGAAMRAQYYLDPSWTFVNHGAFGAVCRVAMTAARGWAEYAETQPLRFIDRELFPYSVAALRAAARLLGAPARNVVALPNVTTGLNAVIRAAGLRPGDVVYSLDVGYGSTKKIIAAVAEATGARHVTGVLPAVLRHEDDIVAAVEASLPAGTRLAVFDHVTSNTGLVLPVARLTAVAKARGAAVLIDGAHGAQALELDVPALGCDWYLTNCHKWLCSTKGLALMYAADAVRDTTPPLVISHGYGAGYTSGFIWDGCRDYAAVVSLPALLAWWDAVGHAAARAYCRGLLTDAIRLLTEAWGTDTHAPPALYSHMACVRLPDAALPPGAVPAATSLHAKLVQDALHYGERVEVPVKTLNSRLYLRISAAVYNCLDDYRAVAAAVTRMADTPGYWDAAMATAAASPPS